MKTTFLVGFIALALCFQAEGGLYPATATSPITIPAGDPYGISSSMDLTSVSGLGSSISGLILSVHFNDTASLLLGEINGTLRLGDYTGAPHIDFNPTTFTTVGTGDYLYSLNTEASGVHFTGSNPHDNWTLFLSNASGANDNQLTGWSLNITAVPEPIDLALEIFGGGIPARHPRQCPAGAELGSRPAGCFRGLG